MSRSGARCPCCPTIVTMEDIRLEGRAGRLGAVMTAVVVDGLKGKEYRLPEAEELCAAAVTANEIDALYVQIFRSECRTEPTPRQGPGAARAFSRPENYGFDLWSKLFTEPAALWRSGTFVQRNPPLHRRSGRHSGGLAEEAIIAMLGTVRMASKLADRGSALCNSWHQ